MFSVLLLGQEFHFTINHSSPIALSRQLLDSKQSEYLNKITRVLDMGANAQLGGLDFN